MDINLAIDSLKKYIFQEFQKTKVTIRPNLHRGHLRALSTEIEDGIAAFLLDILPQDYKVYVDASVRVGRKTHRPDILIVDNQHVVRALVEVKTNMGWCRDASSEIDKILAKHTEMISSGTITCKFSNDTTVTAVYTPNVPVFLVAFTNENCGADRHEANRSTATSKNVKYFCLFAGWYGDELSEADIKNFAADIQNIYSCFMQNSIAAVVPRCCFSFTEVLRHPDAISRNFFYCLFIRDFS